MQKSIFFALALLPLGGCGQQHPSQVKEAWNYQNDPMHLDWQYDRKLTDLPLEANLEAVPWSDTYWPSTRGGLANRWKDWSANPFEAPLKTKEEVAALTAKELAMLSPAEKYDIFIGDYTYPLTTSERQRTSPDAQGWEGLCHGWAPASINFSEPRPTLIESAEGIKIPFGAADVKGLLTYLQGQYSHARVKFLGSRCNIDIYEHPEAANNPECRDTNAGSFHIVIANQLGLRKEAFVADVNRDLQVWNQPIHGFKSTIEGYQEPSEGAAPGTVKEALIDTVMTYTVEVGAKWDALLGTPSHINSSAHYKYRVELNENDEIIGGEWLTDSRPDFIWVQSQASFTGFFTQLKDIYDQASANETPLPDPTRNNQ